MKKKSSPIIDELKKLKKDLYMGDYAVILVKANDSGAILTENIIRNAFTGRLKSEEKLTQIKAATIAMIAERRANKKR